LPDGGLKTRSRLLPAPNTGRMIDTFDDTRPPGQHVELDFGQPIMPSGIQVTESEGHPFHSRKRGSKGDVGGEFRTTKSYMRPVNNASIAGYRVEQPSGSYGWSYKGPCMPMNPYAGPHGQGKFPSSIETSDDDLDELGATAIAQCKPTNSVAELSTALGEIVKDGIPSIIGHQTWKDRTNHARNAGGEYLNVQFGWLPLVNDVQKLMHGVSHAKTVLEQFERDAGKVVRRRFTFPMERKESRVELGEREPFGPTNTVLRKSSPQPTLWLNIVETKRRWFSGAFTYHLPSGYNSRKAVDKYSSYADKILGLNLDPDTLWELQPWSWAIDWFSSTGDVLSNVNDSIKYGLVMQYGYMMETSIVEHTYTLEGGGKPNLYHLVRPLTFVTETKKRRKANPFGFGVKWTDLSSAQTAILVALGLSRS